MNTYLRKVHFENDSKVADIVRGFLNQTSTDNMRYDVSASPVRHYFEEDPTGNNVPEDVLSKDLSQEFARRLQKSSAMFGKKTSFRGYNLPAESQQEIKNLLAPEIVKQNIDMCIQKIGDGDYVTPHRDHTRRAALFYLFSPATMDTRWYEMTESFPEYSNFRYPDMDKITETYREVIEPGQWYVFDSESYHSAHRLPDVSQEDVKRVNFVIQFPNINSKELLEILGQ